MAGLPPELRELAEAVDVHRERLRRLIEVRGEGGLRELYEELHRELQDRIAALSLAGRGDSMTAYQMRALMVQVEEGIAGFTGRFAEHMASVGADAQLFAGEETLDELKALARTFGAAAVPLSIEEVAVFSGLVDELEPSLLRKYHLEAMGYGIDAIGEVERELAKGLATGRTLQENIDAIAPVIRGTEYDAERIVRTETMEAHNRTGQETLKRVARDDMPGLQQQWITIGWSRRENAGLKCETCGPLHGRVREFGQPFGKKSNGEPIYKPTAHPNCLCVLVGWHPDWSRAQAGAVAEKLAGRKPKG